MSFIEIKGLRKEFGDVTPLGGVDFTAEKGDVVCLIGPSGTGKSTLIRCINRLETPTSGEIIIDGVNVCEKGVDIPSLRKKVGMVFQSFNLFGHKSIIDNIIMPQTDLLGKPEPEAREEALKQLRRVGLEIKANNMPDELSGGQKQRAAIARALAMHPEIMLFDEPTSALDPTMVSEVKNVIRKLADDGMTMLIVTHEMQLVKDIASKVLYMDEGVIYEQGTPAEIFEKPKREKTRSFVLKITRWSWDCTKCGYDFIGMTASMEEFCRSRFMSRKQLNSCLLVLDEIFTSYIVPAYEDNDFSFELEVSGDNDEIKLILRYTGDTDPFDRKIDPTSQAIIQKKTKAGLSDKPNEKVYEIVL